MGGRISDFDQIRVIPGEGFPRPVGKSVAARPKGNRVRPKLPHPNTRRATRHGVLLPPIAPRGGR